MRESSDETRVHLRELYKRHNRAYDGNTEHFADLYERHFSSIRQQSLKLLEIGVWKGGSLRMWREYFPLSDITGIEVMPEAKQYESERIQVFIGSQNDESFLRSVVAETGTPDIVIDDGSHRMLDQRISFDTLFPLLAPGGLYVIEDLCTSYWPHLVGGGIRNPDNMIEKLKAMVDGLSWWAYRKDRRRGKEPESDPTWLEQNIAGVHFYDSICFIEKSESQDQPIKRPRCQW